MNLKRLLENSHNLSLIQLSLMVKLWITYKLYGTETRERLLKMNMRDFMSKLQKPKSHTSFSCTTPQMSHFQSKLWSIFLVLMVKNSVFKLKVLISTCIQERFWLRVIVKNCYQVISDSLRELSTVKIYLLIFQERLIKILHWWASWEMP